jgi:hypothetical protein
VQPAITRRKPPIQGDNIVLTCINYNSIYRIFQ